MDAHKEPNFWWAYQTDNFSTVGETLWTQYGITNRNGVFSLRPSSELLGMMEIGDVVIHYWDDAVQAVSVVRVPAVNSRRPVGYPGGSVEEEGHLVKVDDRRPVANKISLPVAAEIVDTGRYKGPLTREGGHGRGAYIGILTADEGHELLRRAGMEQPTLGPTRNEEYREPLWGSRFDETDIETLAYRRAEQERKDLQNVAMLICVLGCDSLYERGYIAVDDQGFVVTASASGTDLLETALDPLSGNSCLRSGNATAAHFRWHRVNTFLGDISFTPKHQ